MDMDKLELLRKNFKVHRNFRSVKTFRLNDIKRRTQSSQIV